jgi:phosphoglycerol transferase MdoB-like AlkP superfamily enzyme
MLRQEVGRKWTLISVATQFFVAYVCAFVIYNISFAIEIFGFWKPFFAIFGILIVIFALFCIFYTKKRRCGCCKNCNLDCRAKDE